MVSIDPSFSFNSRRSPVLSRRGIVATSQSLATAAGLEALAKGGTAADAAVAAAAALAVTEPTSTGLGGDCFALYFDAATRQVTALNGSGRAPAALTIERLCREGLGDSLPPTHAYNVTVPGACAGWFDLLERHGRLLMRDVLKPAVRLAEEGFPVSPVTSYFWQAGARKQLNNEFGGQALTIDGRGPNPGELFRNPGMARTLRLIAEGGKTAFYQGPVAEAICAILKRAGGCMALEDLAKHVSTWEQPISTVYRGVRVWECPPNGQGLVALMALNLLEGFDLHSLPPLSARRLHLTIEALRLAFSDARRYIADPAMAPAPLEGLLSARYAEERRGLIDPLRAAAEPRSGVPYASSDTVYLCAVDEAGNACSFINSNYMGFGTGIVPEGFGFSLQNRGHNFSLDPQHPNALAPGKRPYHTIIPAMATYAEDNRLYAALGVMGGFMQPQGHVQVISALLDDSADPQAALDRPRLYVDAETDLRLTSLEEGIPSDAYSGLAQMGHPVRWVGGMARSLFGRGQIIRRDPESGVLWAGSDPRADGCAMSL